MTDTLYPLIRTAIQAAAQLWADRDEFSPARWSEIAAATRPLEDRMEAAHTAGDRARLEALCVDYVEAVALQVGALDTEPAMETR